MLSPGHQEADDGMYLTPNSKAKRHMIRMPAKLRDEVTDAMRHIVGEQSGVGYENLAHSACERAGGLLRRGCHCRNVTVAHEAVELPRDNRMLL